MRPLSRPALAMALFIPGLALAADVPLAGRKLSLRAGRERAARIVLRDPALAAPFPDPTAGAALVLSGGAGPGQCRVEIALDPGRWRPLGEDGARRGWRYRADAPGTQGVRRILLRAGRLVLSTRGDAWPCDLAADAERLPVTVELRAGGTRYCGAFGGEVGRNVQGRFVARRAPAPAACAETDLTVANLNILHGLFCPPGSGACRLSDRVDLFFQWIAASGCPDVVTIQEYQHNVAGALLDARLGTTCPFTYEKIFVLRFGVDDEVVLARHRPVTVESVLLYKGFRHLLWVRLDHPLGPLDVFTTHLASGSDGARNPCGADCPAECLTAGATTVRECQGVQVGEIVAARHDVPTPAVVTGDFNERPGSFVYAHLTGRGWIDTHLAAGNPECDAATGEGCTSGREDNTLTELESPASNQSARIDFVFLVPPGPGSLCTPVLDPAADDDGDGAATRIFGDRSNPFSPTCGALPDPICWPSDHEGAELDLNCG